MTKAEAIIAEVSKRVTGSPYPRNTVILEAMKEISSLAFHAGCRAMNEDAPLNKAKAIFIAQTFNQE